MKKIKQKKQKGFTLIELLVSIALFSIVVLITIGSILTIVDANRKARSLMTVMNNLNFTIDSMTRSFQTGHNPSNNGSNCFETTEVDYSQTETALEIENRNVVYCFVEPTPDTGKITKNINGNIFDLTSPEIDIDEAEMRVVHPVGSQPILFLNISGTVKESPKISSSFRIQTTVNQRDLEL